MEREEKGLSAGQLTMMALGCVIGGSFFLGTGVAINAAGPGVLISYILCGIVVYYILYAISEMTINNPDSGSFRTYASNAFGKGTGFVVGWVYWTGMALAMSSEAIAISILMRVWYPNISIPLLGSIIIVFVTLVNLLGATRLSKLESTLAAIKIFAIVFFIVTAVMLIVGLFPGRPTVGVGALTREALFPNGIAGIAGSLLIVFFSYAGFEIIGLAASETASPKKTVPRAIRYTVLSLLGLYIISYAVILPLIPTASLNTSISPMVAALNTFGIGWAGNVMNIILVSAILSTMLAAMFGIGRMMRSLAAEGLAPEFLKDHTDVPYKGILISGVAMLVGLGFALLAPQIYLFLIGSAGFAILFTYVVIMATHIRFRIKNGRPNPEDFHMRGYPYSSLFVLLFLVAAIVSMPFIPGQGTGLLAGIIIVAFYTLCYLIMKAVKSARSNDADYRRTYHEKERFSTEISKELSDKDHKDSDDD